MKTENQYQANLEESEYQNRFGNQDNFGNQLSTEKRPMLTLGLKKKSQINQSQRSNQATENAKLTIGLRKKTEDFQFLSDRNGRAGEASNFGFSLKKKHEFIPQKGMKFEQQKELKPKRSSIKMPKTVGKLEVNIKITELPNWVETIKHGWQHFCINVEGEIVQMKVRPKIWQKLVDANEEYHQWIASITGKMGHRIKNGFELLEPAIQIYEKKHHLQNPENEL
ncbi:MAG: hypothetical protein KAI83_05520 [Thiomargarita sp.]|nr:hypothetical protein [Thiomargarita sp.]